MKVYDTIHREELELTREELVKTMQYGNRQVDLIFEKKRTDVDGYLTWDKESWTNLDTRRFVRYYTLNGRVLRDLTTHNIHDIASEFKPEEAMKVELA